MKDYTYKHSHPTKYLGPQYNGSVAVVANFNTVIYLKAI